MSNIEPPKTTTFSVCIYHDLFTGAGNCYIRSPERIITLLHGKENISNRPLVGYDFELGKHDIETLINLFKEQLDNFSE